MESLGSSWILDHCTEGPGSLTNLSNSRLKGKEMGGGGKHLKPFISSSMAGLWSGGRVRSSFSTSSPMASLAPLGSLAAWNSMESW